MERERHTHTQKQTETETKTLREAVRKTDPQRSQVGNTDPVRWRPRECQRPRTREGEQRLQRG